MITKVQNTPNPKPAFTAKWPDARKVIASLPEEHDFFKGLNYTLDGKTISTKKVLLARLDKAAEIVKNVLRRTVSFNLDMPDFSNIYKNPKKYWEGYREQDALANSVKPYRKGEDYAFERSSIEFGYRKKTVTTQESDSINNIANFLLIHGKTLAKELKQAGLKNPKEIEM
jgi:hypothetical protein